MAFRAPSAASSRRRRWTASPQAGLRYTQFHSTALCSPTRAALITGRNHHSVGFGVIGELSTGYPGYDSIIGPENATIGEILQDNGYATSWFGKDHNTPSFPIQRRRAFRPMAGRAWASSISTASWAARPTSGRPICSRDTTQIFPWIGKPGYNLTTDMADEAIRYMHESERGRAGQAVLSLLRARRHATRRTSQPRNGLISSKVSSTWARKSCASRSSPTRSGSA